jgi:hypothetical protein
MANEGHIHIKKKGYKESPRPHLVFFRPVIDRSKSGNFNNRPAWQMRRHVSDLADNVASKENALEQGFVDGESKAEFEQLLAKEKKRLGQILESQDAAEKIVKEDRGFWEQKHKEMGEAISNNMPTENDYHKKKPNPHKIAQMEKKPFKDGMTFQEYKSAYQVIGRALDEESNIANLIRDV